MSIRKKAVIIIAVAFLVLISALIIGAVYINSLVFADNISDIYTLIYDEYDRNYFSEILKNAVRDKEYVLGENAVNTFINEKYCTDFSNTGSGLENLCLRFHENERTEIYARIYTHGKEFALRGQANISCTDEKGGIEIELHDLYIGELHISDDLLRRLLPEFIKSSDNLTVKENRIDIHAVYEYETKYSTIELYLTEFSPTDEGVRCKTNSLKREALDALKDYLLSDDFKEKAAKAWNALKNAFSH